MTYEQRPEGSYSITADDLETILVDRYPIHYSIAFSALQNHQDAEDVVQETSLNAYRTFESQKFKNSSHVEKWLYTITRNTTLDVIRKKIRRGNHVSFDEFADNPHHRHPQHSQDPSAELAAQEHSSKLTSIIYNGLSLLSERHRGVLFLYAFNNHSYDEIAEIMGMSRNTASTLINRARKRIRPYLERRLKELE